MRIHQLATAFIICLACSASADTNRVRRSLDVVVTKYSVLVNGVELLDGSRAGHTHYLSFAAAKKALGPPQVTYLTGLGVTVFAWTGAGIQLQRGFRGPAKGKIFKLQLWLEDTPDREHRQSGKFTGHARIEGVDIPPNSTLDSLQPALERAGFKVKKYASITEATKGQISIFTVDTSSTLERLEVWCP